MAKAGVRRLLSRCQMFIRTAIEESATVRGLWICFQFPIDAGGNTHDCQRRDHAAPVNLACADRGRWGAHARPYKKESGCSRPWLTAFVPNLGESVRVLVRKGGTIRIFTGCVKANHPVWRLLRSNHRVVENIGKTTEIHLAVIVLLTVKAVGGRDSCPVLGMRISDAVPSRAKSCPLIPFVPGFLTSCVMRSRKNV